MPALKAEQRIRPFFISLPASFSHACSWLLTRGIVGIGEVARCNAAFRFPGHKYNSRYTALL